MIEESVSLHLPSTRVNMVFMQPYVHFELPRREPYRWEASLRSSQLDAIVRTLSLARGSDGEDHAHFTIFPEYAIPGLDGVATIQEQIESTTWPTDTIVIGGIDGLSAGEYGDLCATGDSHFAEANAPKKVGSSKWVNSAIIWAKDTGGKVTRWVQPKLHPSDLERR